MTEPNSSPPHHEDLQSQPAATAVEHLFASPEHYVDQEGTTSHSSSTTTTKNNNHAADHPPTPHHNDLTNTSETQEAIAARHPSRPPTSHTTSTQPQSSRPPAASTHTTTNTTNNTSNPPSITSPTRANPSSRPSTALTGTVSMRFRAAAEARSNTTVDEGMEPIADDMMGEETTGQAQLGGGESYTHSTTAVKDHAGSRPVTGVFATVDPTTTSFRVNPAGMTSIKRMSMMQTEVPIDTLTAMPSTIPTDGGDGNGSQHELSKTQTRPVTAKRASPHALSQTQPAPTSSGMTRPPTAATVRTNLTRPPSASAQSSSRPGSARPQTRHRLPDLPNMVPSKDDDRLPPSKVIDDTAFFQSIANTSNMLELENDTPMARKPEITPQNTQWNIQQFTSMLASLIVAVHTQRKHDVYKAFAADFFHSLSVARYDEPELPTDKLIELHSAAWKEARGVTDDSTTARDYSESVGLRLWQQKLTKAWLKQQPADSLQWVVDYSSKFASQVSVDT